MNNKENKSSSNLIKSIYKSYIDLKTGDLHDLDYDILLENIKSLYLDVKAMRVHPFDILEDTQVDSQNSNNLGIVNPNTSSVEKIELEDDKEIEKIEESVTTELEQSTQDEIVNQELGEELIESENSPSNESDALNLMNLTMDSPEITNTDANSSSNEPIETIETDEVEEVEDFNDTMAKTDETETEDMIENTQNDNHEVVEEIEPIDIKENTSEGNNEENEQIDTHLPIIEEPFNEDLTQESNSSEDSSDESTHDEKSDDLLEFELNEKSIKEKNSNNIVSFLKEDSSNNYKPVGDLIDMIDINTRIGLVEIFFKGDSLSLSESLSVLNKSDDRNKSIQIIDKLAEKYDISQEDDIYGTFINLIDRKFGINS